MTTIALTPEGEEFLARLRDQLADLPPDERDELLEDIESHIAEVAGEGGVPLAARLGSAEEFAQELRHSAGLPPRTPDRSPSRLALARVRAAAVQQRLAVLRANVDGTLLWRIARGWLLAVAAAIVISRARGTSEWGHAHAWLPHPWPGGYGSALVIAGLVALSLWIGRRASAGRGVSLDRAASALALLAIIPAFVHLDGPPSRTAYVHTLSVEAVPGLAYDGQTITNVFPFDRNGKPLNDVLLYLPDGRPLDVSAQVVDPNRRYLVTRRGQRLYNSFPVRYFDPGTTSVTHPEAGPVVHVPKVLTPPLAGAAR